MKKIFLITAIAIAIANAMFAQGNKSVFFEIGGNGLVFSANFDSRFTKSEKGFGFRIGIGFIPAINSGDADIFYPSTPSALTIPIGINHLAGNAPHYFESGLGITYVHVSGKVSSDFWGYSEDVTGSAIGFVPSIGYRYAKIGKAFQGRIFISPIISSGGASFWGGLSVGYKF
jgi:hypothetical protein